jgi:hypothetical protein
MLKLIWTGPKSWAGPEYVRLPEPSAAIVIDHAVPGLSVGLV